MYFIAISMCVVALVNGRMEPFVIGGDYARIKAYPHSVFLNIVCKDGYICGGSIVNQNIVLTAGHCLEDCRKRSDDTVIVNFGDENINRMTKCSMRSFKIHKMYDSVTLQNDIALVSTKYPIPLGHTVKRVVILPNPSLSEWGYVAGWGVIDKEEDETTVLKYTVQKLQSVKVCRLLGDLPRGTFCAGPITGVGAPAEGDSGSALVIRNFIQIGLVSYKVHQYSLTAYTNVSYYYKWLQSTTEKLYCRRG